MGRAAGRSRRGVRRLESRRFGEGVVGPDRRGSFRRAHPRRRPGRLDCRRRNPRDRNVVPEPGDVTVSHDDLYAGARPTLTADQAAAVKALLDARAPERFRGDVEPIDPVAGHIPGAQERAEHRFAGRRRHFLRSTTSSPGCSRARRGGRDTGVYCGSGVTASVVLAALATVGIDAALFPGRGPNGCSDPARPSNVARRARRPARRPTSQHTRKIANEIVVTNTDTGTPGASDNRMPPTAEISANTTDATMVATGETNTRAAAAAGVISSDITSSAPTIWTPCAAVTPTRAANTMPSARTGTPRPAATSRVDGGEQQRAGRTPPAPQ